MAVAKLTMTWVGLPPALSESFLLGRRQPWRFLGFYGSTSGGRELAIGSAWGRGLVGAGPQRGRPASRVPVWGPDAPGLGTRFLARLGVVWTSASVGLTNLEFPLSPHPFGIVMYAQVKAYFQ